MDSETLLVVEGLLVEPAVIVAFDCVSEVVFEQFVAHEHFADIPFFLLILLKRSGPYSTIFSRSSCQIR